VLHAPLDLRVQSRPVPTPRTHEVLVEVLAVGICGSDVHYFEHGRIGSRVVTEPLVLGHETCGRVVALGPDSSRHQIGDRVCLEPGMPCRACRECRAGRYNLCGDVRFHGAPPVDGSLTNYLAVHEDFAIGIPPSISDEAGALIEPLAVAVWACRKASVSAGDRVLVTGAGPIGLLVAQTARAQGAGRIVLTDVSEPRLQTARRFGFTDVVDVGRASLRDMGYEFDALVECSGSGTALDSAIELLRPAGVAVMVGMGEERVTLPLDLLQRRELWVTGSFRYANVFPAAIALADQGRIDLETLITDRYPLEDTVAALRAGRDDPGSIKAIVLPSG
jgi:L-iditol 2-dehydrogenase